MTKERIIFLDLAKGICMTLLVMFHCNVNYDFHGVFYHLRLPLFFFLSGLFFKDYGGVVKTMVRKIDSFILPLCFFAALITAAWLICPAGAMGNPRDFVWSFIHLRPTHTIWFLMCLFSLNMMFYAVVRLIGDGVLVLTLSVVVIASCGWLLSYHCIRLPFYADTAMTLFPFFYCGYMIKRTNFLYHNAWDKFNPLFALTCLVLAMVLAYFLPAYPEHVNNYYPGSFPPVYSLECALMLFGLLFLCKAVKRLPVVSFVGRYSIVVLGMHRVVMPFVVVLVGRFVNLTPELEFVIVYTLCVISIKPMIRLFPYFTAQKYPVSAIYAKFSQSAPDVTAKS